MPSLCFVFPAFSSYLDFSLRIWFIPAAYLFFDIMDYDDDCWRALSKTYTEFMYLCPASHYRTIHIHAHIHTLPYMSLNMTQCMPDTSPNLCCRCCSVMFPGSNPCSHWHSRVHLCSMSYPKAVYIRMSRNSRQVRPYTVWGQKGIASRPAWGQSVHVPGYNYCISSAALQFGDCW